MFHRKPGRKLSVNGFAFNEYSREEPKRGMHHQIASQTICTASNVCQCAYILKTSIYVQYDIRHTEITLKPREHGPFGPFSVINCNVGFDMLLCLLADTLSVLPSTVTFYIAGPKAMCKTCCRKQAFLSLRSRLNTI